MRQHFSGQLENMRTDLTDLCSLTETAIDHATRALLDTDLGASEACADVDTEIGYRAQEIDHRALTLIALQAPVAQDLRALISGIHNIADLRRMGSLAAHVAEVARLHFPAPVVPGELRGVISEMGVAAKAQAAAATEVLRDRDCERALELIRQMIGPMLCFASCSRSPRVTTGRTGRHRR